MIDFFIKYSKTKDKVSLKKKIESTRNYAENVNIWLSICSSFIPSTLIAENYELAASLGIMILSLLGIDFSIDKDMNRYCKELALNENNNKCYKILKRDTASSYLMAHIFKYSSIIISLVGMTFSLLNFESIQIPVILAIIIVSVALSSMYADSMLEYQKGVEYCRLIVDEETDEDVKVKKII